MAYLLAIVTCGLWLTKAYWFRATYLSQEEQEEMIEAAMPVIERAPLPRTIKPLSDVVLTAVSPDKRLVATVFNEKRGSSKADFRYVDLGLQIYEAKTGRLVRQLIEDGDVSGVGVFQIAFSRDGRILYALTGGKFQGWRVSDGKCVTELEIGFQREGAAVTPISAFTISPNGRDVVFYQGRIPPTASTLFLRDLTEPDFERLLGNPHKILGPTASTGSSGLTGAVYFSPDGKTLFVHGEHGALTRWRVH
jgi:WD40 repeat protein